MTEFVDIPSEARINMYSNLSTAEDFLAVWQANKLTQQDVEKALFTKTGVIFYKAQFRILSILIYSQPSMRSNVDLGGLAETFLANLANLDLSLPEILRGLKLVAAVYQVPLDINPIMRQLNHHKSSFSIEFSCLNAIMPALTKDTKEALDYLLYNPLEGMTMFRGLTIPTYQTVTTPTLPKPSIELAPRSDSDLAKWIILMTSKLQGDDTIICLDTLKCLTFNVPTLTSERLVILSTPVVNMLKNSDTSIVLAALKCLEVMSLRLDTNTLKTWIDLIVEIIKNGDNDICDVVLAFLTTISPRFNKNTLITLTSLVVKKLENSTVPVHVAALKYLITIGQKLDIDTLETWIDPITKTMEDGDGNHIFFLSLQCLEVHVVPKLASKNLVYLINVIVGKLQNSNPQVRRHIKNWLRDISSKLDTNNLETLTDWIIKILRDDDSEVCDVALAFLTEISPIVDKNTLATWTDLVVEKLENSTVLICKEALKCLTAMSLRIDADISEIWIDPVVKIIKDGNDEVCTGALAFLTTISLIVNKNTLTTWTNLVVGKLENSTVLICKEALKCLTAMSLRIDADISEIWIDPVVKIIKDGDDEVCIGALAFLNTISPITNKNTLMTLIDPVVGRLSYDHWWIRSLALDCLMTILPIVKTLKPELISHLIESLAPHLSDNDNEIRELHRQLIIYLVIYFNKESLVLRSTSPLLIEKDALLPKNYKTTDLLLTQTICQWLEHIKETKQNNLMSSKNQSKADVSQKDTAYKSKEQALLKQVQTHIKRFNSDGLKKEMILKRLQNYTNRIEAIVDANNDKSLRYAGGFWNGFWVCRESRAINREINHRLAQDLFTQLKEKKTSDVFNNDNIQKTRQSIIKTHKLDERPGYVERKIGSSELNRVIQKAQANSNQTYVFADDKRNVHLSYGWSM